MLPQSEAKGRIQNMLAALGLCWWQHIIVKGLHEHCIQVEICDSIAAEVPGTTKTLVLRIQSCLSGLAMFFKMHKMVFDQNLICCDNQQGARVHVTTCSNISTITCVLQWLVLRGFSRSSSFGTIAVAVV